MKSVLVVSLTLCLLWNVSARADLVLQPPGLKPGDQYRLVFVTSGTTNALSSNIADYNAFVQGAADGSPLAALHQTWRAIGSTTDYSALVNTNSDPLSSPGLPFYGLDGQRIAQSNAVLWSGLLESGPAIAETGEIVRGVVWTGTDPSGHSAYPLGTSLVNWGFARAIVPDWIQSVIGPDSQPYLQDHIYAVSGPITATPEPKSGTLACLAILGIGAWRAVKRFVARRHQAISHSAVSN